MVEKRPDFKGNITLGLETFNTSTRNHVIPAQAGIQRPRRQLDPRLRGDDEDRRSG